MSRQLTPSFPNPQSLTIEKAENKLALAQILEAISITQNAMLGMHADLQIAPDFRNRSLASCAIASLSKGLVALMDARRELLRQPKMGALRADLLSMSAARTKGFGIAFAAWDDPTLKSTDEKVARVKKSAIDLAAQELEQITGPDAVPEDDNNERIANERNQPDAT